MARKTKSKSTTRAVVKTHRTTSLSSTTQQKKHLKHRISSRKRKSSAEIVHVVVSTQGTRCGSLDLSGVTAAEVLMALRKAFADQIVIDADNESVDITETSFYRRMKKHMTPGKYLRVYRERAGWSQSELGDRIGNLQRQHVSRLERGKRGISKEMAKRLAELFSVPVDRFV